MKTEFLDSFMIYVTFLGAVELSIIAAALLSILLVVYRKIKEAVWINIVIIGGIAYNFILKLFINRERPGESKFIEAFGVNFEMASYSFPSGHTMRITLLMLVLTFLLFKLVPLQTKSKNWVLSIGGILILLVAFSRIYLNYHYISDAAASILLGGIFFYFMTKIRPHLNLSV
ncbi:phosphatase PAP2 family protein [Alkalicoccus daliensis]|nr:phosphatase PAP2 family protein [Alkalicoccus daliensis]